MGFVGLNNQHGVLQHRDPTGERVRMIQAAISCTNNSEHASSEASNRLPPKIFRNFGDRVREDACGCDLQGQEVRVAVILFEV